MNAREIFLQAIEIEDARQRSEFVVSVCAGDEALQSRVEALLAAHDAPESYLDKPLVDGQVVRDADRPTVVDNAVREGPGAIIDNYKLLQEIGHGGFGVVYMAEQEQPVRRTVALKIIKPGMDTREVIARFEAERQALALMDHPNIAHVLDAGSTASGRPYFVMELVKGVPITTFCDRNSLTTQQRLELFVAVCHAVQHAHQKGVIHRDLKPSNIMVTLHDGDPVPKVIDFGVSKAISQKLTDKTLFTRYGQMVGTPQYMSPEQAEMSGLDVDTRSDIYSLGVLLYELLTGTTPLKLEKLRSAGYAEILRLIQEQEAMKPSTRLSTLSDELTVICKRRSTNERTLGTMLRGDLDWIVMKALDKDRNRRYDSATAFANDVRRHLNDEPVQAAAPSTMYLMSKLVRRNKGLVAAVVSVAAALAIGCALATYGLIRADRDRRLAQSREQDAAQARELADLERAKAVAARDEAEDNFREAAESRLAAEHANTALEHRLYDDAVLRASEIAEGQTQATRKLLDSCPDHLRNWEWYRLDALTPRIETHDLTARDALNTIDPTTANSDSPNYLTVETDGTVALRSLKTQQVVWTKKSNVPPPIIPTYSTDGKTITLSTHFSVGIAGGDSKAEIWNRNGDVLWASVDPKRTYYIPPISSDGKWAAISSLKRSGSLSGKVELLDTENWESVWQRDFQGLCLVEFSKDAKYLICAQGRNLDTSKPAMVYCLDVTNGETVWQFRHSALCRPVMDPSGTEFVLSGHNHNLYWFDIRTGSPKRTVRGYMPDSATFLNFSPDGKRLFTFGSFGHIAFWDTANLTVTERVHRDRRYLHVPDFTADGKRYGMNDELVSKTLFVDFEGGKLDVVMDSEGASILDFEIMGASDRDSPDLISVDEEGIVRRWQADRGLETAAKSPFSIKPKRGAIRAEKNWIVAANDDAVELYDGQCRRITQNLSLGNIKTIEFSPDGSLLAVGYDQGLKLWRTSDWKELPVESFDRSVQALCFAGDQTVAVALTQAELLLFDVDSRERQVIRPRDPVSFAQIVRFLPGSKRVALGVEQRVEIWDLDQRERVHTFNDGIARVCSLLVSEDERRIFVGNEDGELSVRNLETGTLLARWDAHGSNAFAIRKLQLAPNGTLYSCGSDGTIKAWESRRPSEDLVRDRMNVAQAYRTLNRHAQTASPEGLLKSIHGDNRLPDSVKVLAGEILKVRDGLPQLPSRAIEDPFLGLGLEGGWSEAVLEGLRLIATSTEDLEQCLEEIAGHPLEQIDALPVDANTWADKLKYIARLPIDTEILGEVIYEVQSRYPESPLVEHMIATYHASHSRWSEAVAGISGTLSRFPDGRVPEESEFCIVLRCQLAAIYLHLDAVDSARKELEFIRENLPNELSHKSRIRIARLTMALDDSKSTNDFVARLLSPVRRESLSGIYPAWFNIVQGQLAFRRGEFQDASQLYLSGMHHVVGRRMGVYAHAALVCLDFLASEKKSNRAQMARDLNALGFIRSVAPHARSDWSEVHYDFEDWIYSSYFDRLTFEARHLAR